MERCAGERLVPEKSVPKFRTSGRISVLAAALSPGTDIWRLGQLLASMVRALRSLPGGIGRFVRKEAELVKQEKETKAASSEHVLVVQDYSMCLQKTAGSKNPWIMACDGNMEPD